MAKQKSKADVKERLLAAAEKRVRAGGFPSMSFRDIADDVGVKSASVHYHFPTKADLGEALIDAYTERFEKRLETIDRSQVSSAIEAFIQLYREALVIDESICLCAITGAEAIGLPKSMNQKTRAFFDANMKWLQTLFAPHIKSNDSDLAAAVVAALEGAIIVSSVSRDASIFDQVSRSITTIIEREVV